MSANVTELRTLMRERGLSRKDVAKLCDVSIHSVNAWLKPPHAKSYRPMHRRELRHLQLELRARTN